MINFVLVSVNSFVVDNNIKNNLSIYDGHNLEIIAQLLYYKKTYFTPGNSTNSYIKELNMIIFHSQQAKLSYLKQFLNIN